MMPFCVRQLCLYTTFILHPFGNTTMIYLENYFSFTLSPCDLESAGSSTLCYINNNLFILNNCFYFEVIIGLHAVVRNNTERSNKYRNNTERLPSFCQRDNLLQNCGAVSQHGS